MDYKCGRCKGFHDDEEEVKYVKFGNDMIEVVQRILLLRRCLEVMMFKAH